MKILDWYILKKFLSAFFFIVFIFIAIIVVIDVVEKLEDWRKMKPGFWQITTVYYFNFIPYIINLISPIIVFISTVFVTSQLASRTEIVAMMSGGISFFRILRPYLIGAVFLSILTFILVGWIIPDANKVRLAFEIQHIKSKYQYNQRNVHIGLSNNVMAYLESYDNLQNVGYRFTLEKLEKNKLIEKLETSKITWDSTKRKWRISGYTLRKINGLQETFETSQNTIDTTLNIKAEDFESKYMYNEKLTLPELEKYIGVLRQRGSEGITPFLVEKYGRYTYPFAIIILTIFGVIVSIQKSRRGVGAKVALGLSLAFLYILLFIISSRGIANSGKMSPLLAVWLPNITFTMIGIFMYQIMILQNEALHLLFTKPLIFAKQYVFVRRNKIPKVPENTV